MIAAHGLGEIRRNPYPGRGLVVGVSEDGALIQACWLTGRSADSRKRIYQYDPRTGEVRVRPIYASAPRDPLRHYTAMIADDEIYAVGNGDHVEVIFDAMTLGVPLASALNEVEYEADPPINTSRIVAVSDRYDGRWNTHFGIVSKHHVGGTMRSSVRVDTVEPGYGFCVHTYECDGNPPPAFNRLPFLVPLRGMLPEVAQDLLAALAGENFVALAVRLAYLDGGLSRPIIINACDTT
jgi:IMP cyclohydrolase